MNTPCRLTLFTAIIAVSLPAGAEKVYESTNKEGVVEFSDQASGDAREVQINPNVVDTAPTKPFKAYDSTPPTPKTTPPAAGGQPEVIHQGVDNYDGDPRLRHKIREERVEHRDKAAQVPARPGGTAGAGTVHRGAHSR